MLCPCACVSICASVCANVRVCLCVERSRDLLDNNCSGGGRDHMVAMATFVACAFVLAGESSR